MSRRLGIWVAATALTLNSVASAQAGPEGLYVANIRETATAIELRPDGRFSWAFSTGALDLMAEGRWVRDASGGVVLDTEPVVRPPETALIGTGPGDGEGLSVRVEDPDGEIPSYLIVEGEAEGREPVQARFWGDVYRFEPEDRVERVRLGISWTGYRSLPFAVPADANRLRLRFTPNDLGRADFRAERALIVDEVLTLTLLGQPLSYRRVSEEERSASDGATGDGPDPEMTGSLAEIVLDSPLTLSIGARLDPRLNNAMVRPGLAGTMSRVDLRFQIGDRVIDFGQVGGTDLMALIITLSGGNNEVAGINFGYQDRLFTAAEAFAQGQVLENRLRTNGFAESPAIPGWPVAAFQVTELARDEPGEPIIPDPAPRGSDWESALRMIDDPAQRVAGMHLFTLRQAEVRASAMLINARLLAIRDDAPLTVDHQNGREWLLNVDIGLDPALEQPTEAASGD